MTADAPLQQRFGLIVTPQNVLGIRAVVLQEAHDLDKVLRVESEQLSLLPLGGDPVSPDMSSAFNEVTQQLLARANQHIDSLFALGAELGATAQTYGHTEAGIEASFKPGSSRTDASRLSPVMSHAAGMGTTATRPSPGSITDLLVGGRS